MDDKIKALVEEARRLDEEATKGPWTYEPALRQREETVHFVIRTEENQPDHPHSPRFLFWACGTLRQATPNMWRDWRERRELGEAFPFYKPEEIEPDCRFATRSRTLLPALADAVEEMGRQLAATELRAAAAEKALEAALSSVDALATEHDEAVPIAEAASDLVGHWIATALEPRKGHEPQAFALMEAVQASRFKVTHA